MKKFKVFSFFLPKMKPKFIPVNCEYKKFLSWYQIGETCDDISFLEDNIENYKKKFYFNSLCGNYYATPILMKNKPKIDLHELGRNTNPIALNYLEKRLDGFIRKPSRYFENLFKNTSEKAIKLIEKISLMKDKSNERVFIRKNTDCECCDWTGKKCLNCYSLELGWLTDNESAVHIIETIVKDEKLNGVDKLNVPLYMLPNFDEKKYNDQYENKHKKGRHHWLHSIDHLADIFWAGVARNKNASSYLIEKLEYHVQAKMDRENELERADLSIDQGHIYVFILRMLQNKDNEKIRNLGKKLFLKLMPIDNPKSKIKLVRLQMDTIRDNNYIDLIETLYPKYVNYADLAEESTFQTDQHVIAGTMFWQYVCSMNHPRAIEIVQENISTLTPCLDEFIIYLSENPAALPILETNEDIYLNVYVAFGNPNKDIYPLIKKKLEPELDDMLELNDITFAEFKYKNTQRGPGSVGDIVKPFVFPEGIRLPTKKFYSNSYREQYHNNFWANRKKDIAIRNNFKKLYEDGFKDPILEEHWKANSMEFCRENITRVNLVDAHIYESYYLVNWFNKIDYDGMKEENSEFRSELASYVFHPARVERMADSFQIEFSEYLESLE